MLNIDQHIRKSGFTLVEILVVVSIIAILMGFVTTAVFNARVESRDAARQTDLQQFKLVMRLYKEAYGDFPEYPGGIEIGVGQAIDAELEPFLGEVNGDPLSEPGGGGTYGYWYDSLHDCGGATHAVLITEFEVELGNYTEVCGPIAASQPSTDSVLFGMPWQAVSRSAANLLVTPKAEAFSQLSYYSQSSYYSQATYYGEGTYYAEGAYEGAYYTESTYYSENLYYTETGYYNEGAYYSETGYYAESSYVTNEGDYTPTEHTYILIVN